MYANIPNPEGVKAVKTSRDNVKSLYTNIPNSEEVKALKTSHDNFPRKTITTKLIATFLPLILTLSNFAFNCKNYIQIKDCTMGTICAPSYVNIFMDHFERKCLSPVLQGLSLIYLKFIDDIFFTWTGSKD